MGCVCMNGVYVCMYCRGINGVCVFEWYVCMCVCVLVYMHYVSYV